MAGLVAIFAEFEPEIGNGSPASDLLNDIALLCADKRVGTIASCERDAELARRPFRWERAFRLQLFQAAGDGRKLLPPFSVHQSE
jgi:hypothetical protein